MNSLTAVQKRPGKSQIKSLHRQSAFGSSPTGNLVSGSSRFSFMTKLNAISPRNTMAISAMLMLSPGLAHAQDATAPMTDAPVLSAPATTTTAPTTTAPTIVIPTPSPEPTIAPEAGTTAATTPATAEPPVRAAPQPRIRASTRPSPSESTATTASAVPLVAPVAAVAPPAPAPAADAPPVATVDDLAVANGDATPEWALPVGAAVTLLVLGGIGLAMTRRRRAYEADVDFVPPVTSRPPARPLAETRAALPAPRMVPTAPAHAMTPIAPMASTSEREALVERIVASPPDAANPFTSRKARRRRARIMVQSMTVRSDAPARSAERPVIRQPEYARV